MNREFLEFYNRELSLLREQAGRIRAGISRASPSGWAA